MAFYFRDKDIEVVSRLSVEFSVGFEFSILKFYIFFVGKGDVRKDFEVGWGEGVFRLVGFRVGVEGFRGIDFISGSIVLVIFGETGFFEKGERGCCKRK